MDVTRTLFASPVPDGLAVGVFLLNDALVEAAVRAAVIAAPVDAAAVGPTPHPPRDLGSG
ncbi:MAG: hypothetical protein Q9184_003633 [Pyrenodesmia sp. 2 TL-2023]